MLKLLNQYKFAIAFLALLLWMLLFDANSVVDQWKRTEEIRALKQERNYYLEQMEITRKEQEQLFSNLDALERFARERYMMKRDNEDLFIIREED